MNTSIFSRKNAWGISTKAIVAGAVMVASGVSQLALADPPVSGWIGRPPVTTPGYPGSGPGNPGRPVPHLPPSGGPAQALAAKAEDLARDLRQRGHRLSGAQSARIQDLLREAQAELDNYGPTPPIPGPYPPSPGPYPPRVNQCELVGPGVHNGYNYNYRILVNGSSLAAADSLDTALSKLRDLEAARVCTTVVEACTLSGVGTHGSYNYNFRVSVGGAQVAAADSMSSIESIVGKLEQAGVCRVQARGACQLLGGGAYRGYSWNNRIAIGNEIVDADDNLTNALNKMNNLRAGGYCY
ncbi:MAG: hypothetical protein AB7P04_09300 [Bacteriovoracia bacterium]